MEDDFDYHSGEFEWPPHIKGNESNVKLNDYGYVSYYIAGCRGFKCKRLPSRERLNDREKRISDEQSVGDHLLHEDIMAGNWHTPLTWPTWEPPIMDVEWFRPMDVVQRDSKKKRQGWRLGKRGQVLRRLMEGPATGPRRALA